MAKYYKIFKIPPKNKNKNKNNKDPVRISSFTRDQKCVKMYANKTFVQFAYVYKQSAMSVSTYFSKLLTN